MSLPSLSSLPGHAARLLTLALDKFLALSLAAKCGVALLALIQLVAVYTLVRLGTHGVLERLFDAALWFSHWPTLGPLLLIALITLLSFPPLVGYGTSITLCGLAYGTPLPENTSSGLFTAWLLAATGCLCGSTAVFVFFRAYLRTAHAPQWIADVRNKREWLAMERAVSAKGARMILLVRFCPFPFVYSNLFFASLQPGVVSLRAFLLATLATTPKLFLHVFIGAQAFQAIQAARGGSNEGGGGGGGGAGGDSNSNPSPPAHSLLSLAYIIIASLVGVATSWYIWQETTRILQEFIDDDEAGAAGEGHSAEADVEEGLLRRQSGENGE